MNRIRLNSSLATLADAQAAYERALQARSAATADTAAAASDAVDRARALLNAARGDIDRTRLEELATIETSDALLGAIAGQEVLALFPVGVEAKLEPGRLRIRVWPDAISTSTHDPQLTPDEVDVTCEYWRVEVRSPDEAASREAWRALAGRLGPTRAAWTAHVLTPANLEAARSGAAPVFPAVAMQDEQAPFVPRAGVLPDRWVALGIRDNERVVQAVGAPIPLDLAVGLDTTPSETASLTNREGEPIQLPPRMRWMTDFATAVQVGMALDVAISAEIDRLDELLIVGVRTTQTAAQNAAAVADLLTGHRFSRGLAFVPQDTPTNNSVAGGSGLPSRLERVDLAFTLERHSRAFAAGTQTNGVVAAQAFGVAPDILAAIPDAGAASTIAAEPDGFEPGIARAMRTALWQVTVGTTLEDFLLLPTARAEAVREFFCHHVHAAGPVPAVRVGRQPYGVLPVTTIDGFTAMPGEAIDPRLLPLLRAARSWYASLRRPSIFGETAEDALRHLGRSTKVYAESTWQNSMAPGDNRWRSLAGSLARASRNAIQDTWRNGRIRGTVDGVPQPVTLPVVEPETPAAIGALATAPPDAMLSSALPATVLGRVVRHAALLEWSRFARAVCDAALDEASRDDLATRAMLSGSDVYIGVLAHAMTERPPVGPGPVGPAEPLVDGGEPTRPEGPVIGPIGPGGPARPPGTIRPPGAAPLGGGRVSRAGRRNDTLGPADAPDRLPLPDRPDRPDRPDPVPPPAGQVAVSAGERQRIRNLVGSLATPLGTCPGATRLASFRQSLQDLSQCPSGRLEAELFRTLDIASHRLDAWFTALASCRLATLRRAQPEGVVIGGWGCLLDVQRTDLSNPARRAEFIHTPSLDHAAAAAVLRSAARRAERAGSRHADIDLSSRRVRLARWVLDGIRNGRSLSDLLGARFERAVKGTSAEAQLPALRAQFPGFAGRGVLDGLRLHAERPPAADPDMQRALAAVDETVDAVTDALTAEAVYQIVRGNPVGALTDLEALAAGAVPPPLRVTETPQSGVRLTHRIAIVLPADAAAPGWQSRVTPRSRAEPLLDAWCGFVLGPAARVTIALEDATGGRVDVPLAQLGVAAIDVVLAARHHGSELEELAVRAARASQPALLGLRVHDDPVWRGLLALCEAVGRVLTRGEVLRSDAFEPPAALPAARPDDFGDLPDRVDAARAELMALRTRVLARELPAETVAAAGAWGIRIPGMALDAAPTIEQQDALCAAIESRLAASASGTPGDRLRALFGGDIPGVVTFTLPDPATVTSVAGGAAASMFDGDPFAPGAWLDAVGRVHPQTATLAEVLLRQEIASGAARPIAVAQVPWQDGDRWIATAFTSSAGQPPAGRLSVVMHIPAGLPSASAAGGLLVDAWTDTIPEPTRDTAMALRFNNASTRAPQAILLAVNPDPAQAWTTDTLVGILRQTLMLTRWRMEGATLNSRSGLMPFAFLGQRAGSTGISLTL